MMFSYILMHLTLILHQVSDQFGDQASPSGLLQPTLVLLCSLLNFVTAALERAAEEKFLLFNKVKNQGNTRHLYQS